MVNGPEFELRAAETPPWATLRVSLTTIEWLAAQWAAPDALMARVWGAFRSSEAHFRAQLPKVGPERLAAVSSRELVKYLVVAAAIDQGITGCTPDLPDLPRRDKAVLYYQAMLMGFLGNAFRRRVPPPRALEWVVMKALGGAACYAMARLLTTEARRRGARHSGGYSAALLELLRRSERLVPLFDVGDAQIVDGLTQAARGRAAALLKGRGLRHQVLDFLEGLAGQAAVTVEKEWGAVDPLDLVARAMDGELDHAGQVIAYDVADAARPATRWRELQIDIAEEEVERIPDRAGTQPGDQDAQDRYRDLRRRAAAADPKLQRYLEAASDGADRKTIAARLGVSTAYVDKCRARLKKLAEDLPQ